MISIWKQDNKYSILHGNTQLGKVELYSNANHSINSYAKLDMKYYDNGISAELFGKLKVIAGRPLQAMVDSDDDALVDFLLAGGFVCKRKCYEVEAFADDYIKNITQRCKVILALCAVNAVIDSNETDVFLWENHFRIHSHLKIVSP